jgi:Lecithin retinol acyltransferase
MNSNTLELGDIIRIQCPGYQHVGVYVGVQGVCGECVIHNSKLGGVILSTLTEFSGGSQIFIHQKATCPWYERGAIVQRAWSLLGSKYNLFNFNCEHAAYYAQRGKAESPQISAFAFIALLLFGGLTLVAANRQT